MKFEICLSEKDIKILVKMLRGLKVQKGYVVKAEDKRSPNYGTNWRAIRREVLERDNYECQRCGKRDGLQVHHIIPFDDWKSANNKPSNLATLCTSCHRIMHQV